MWSAPLYVFLAESIIAYMHCEVIELYGIHVLVQFFGFLVQVTYLFGLQVKD